MGIEVLFPIHNTSLQGGIFKSAWSCCASTRIFFTWPAPHSSDSLALTTLPDGDRRKTDEKRHQ